MNQKQKILYALKDGNWVSFTVLNDIGYRYGARKKELIRDGIDIDKKCVRGHWFYRLITSYKSIDMNTCKLKPLPPESQQQLALR